MSAADLRPKHTCGLPDLYGQLEARDPKHCLACAIIAAKRP